MTGQASNAKTYDIVEVQPETIIVHCSDPRFQKAFAEFIRDELQLKEGSYVPLVISGGIASLSEPLKLPKEFKFMKDRIEMFLARFPSVEQIVLINHEDCRHYEALKNLIGKLFLRHFVDLIARQKIDLKNVAQALLGFSSLKVQIKCYYAKFADPDRKRVEFEEVKL